MWMASDLLYPVYDAILTSSVKWVICLITLFGGVCSLHIPFKN